MEPRSSPGLAAGGPDVRDPAGRDPGAGPDDPSEPAPAAASVAFGPPGCQSTVSRPPVFRPTNSGPTNSGPIVPELIVADRRWNALVRDGRRVVARAARLGGGAGSVLLTTDEAVRRLNARHRGQNHVTNVLTFEAAPGVGGGDIVLALGVVRREADAAGRSAAHHLAHLVLHGALHLRGHDHHAAGAARRMEMREAWLLHRMGVPNPWRVAGERTAARCEAGDRGAGYRGTGDRGMGGRKPAGPGAGVWQAGGVARMHGVGVLRHVTKQGVSVLRAGTDAGLGQGRVLPGVTR